MPRRKELNGVAAGIASSFSSRNNDVDGFWALGMLYLVATEAGTSKFSLDLMSGESVPEFKFSKRVAAPYFEYLIEQIKKKRFKEHQVTNAIVEVEFNVAPTKRQIIFKSTWGDPFVCRAILTDDLNKKHIGEKRSWCGQHDAKREQRSTRRYAL
jgi:hypothetical protein